MTTLSCTAGYGSGGLGRHFSQLVEESRQRGDLEAYYCPAPEPGDEAGHTLQSRPARRVLAYTPVRFSPGWRTFFASELFDRAVARCITQSAHHVGFSGQSLQTFESLPRAALLELVSPTAHVKLLADRYATATRAYPIEEAWLNNASCRKTTAEYARANCIQVASDYARKSFLDSGVPPEKLVRVDLQVPARYTPGLPRPDDALFRAIYVGALTVTKGVPVLIDAFRRFHGNAELVLLGGWTSRGMRKYLRDCLSADPRIRITLADPLEELRAADVLVHPSYSDGFGYAPMEAIACGIPVIVTEDTGMKERVVDGVNGWVIPTGDSTALLERLEALRKSTPRRATPTRESKQ